MQLKKIVKSSPTRLALAGVVFAAGVALLPAPPARADQTAGAEIRAQFLRLCDGAVAKVSDADSKGPFFVDSYAVRALCAGYDLTGNAAYLDACRDWSDRMVKDQEQMTPPGAYYMHYNRRPGETNGDWYSADSSSIGMAVLATAVRCPGAERDRLLGSAEKFADLVINHYVQPDGGVSDGLWHQSRDAWWCSSGLFGSFLFNLYANTGNPRYLKTALGVTAWLNHLDLTKDQPFPLSQQGPAMIFYVMENYSAGWPYIEKNQAIRPAALAKVNWCLDWMAQQQGTPLADRPWPPTKGWGMKFGGLPFHEYIFSHDLPADGKLTTDANAEMHRLAALAFTEKPKFTQLSAFLMMSYAERIEPGAIYKSVKR